MLRLSHINLRNIQKLLLEIYDPPPILSYKGNIELLNHNKCVAIVDAGNASANGRSFAHKIANDLVKEK